MGNTLYLECATGISGDMFVAAMLDLGANQDRLQKALASLPVDGFQIRISQVKKAGLDVCDFDVVLDEQHENRDHDMEYLYGHLHTEAGQEHGHTHEHTHQEHEHTHTQEHLHDHAHEHRTMRDIEAILAQATLSERARKTAQRIFQVLAEAEARAHGVPVTAVHFHEVGAVDSIVDIVAAAVCLDDLDITSVIVPSVCEGTGTVRCQHGILPVPVPAVTNIVQRYHIPLRITDTKGELVTPTGAAIVAAMATSFQLPEILLIQRVGMGAGKRAYETPSILRAMLIQSGSGLVPSKTENTIWKLESNIDDCSGEQLGYVMERLFEAGARDVHYLPVYMKKNRPAYELVVICDQEKISALEQIIFQETTTIGIRRIEMERTVLSRTIETRTLSKGGKSYCIQIKKCTLPDGNVRYYPEYDSVSGLAREWGISFEEAFDFIKEQK